MTRRTFVLLPLALAHTRRATASPAHERGAAVLSASRAWPTLAAESGGQRRDASTVRPIRVRVLGLFHPRIVTIAPAGDGTLALLADGATGILRDHDAASVVIGPRTLEVDCSTRFSTSALRIVGPSGDAAALRVGVPGKIARTFHGRADVTAVGDEIAVVVSMDLETAVASVVAAEQIASTPIEALAAQAIAARSYYTAAHGRHRAFDFCDTTHCQFLREPPPADSPASHAACDTAGLVLAYGGEPIAALYSAHCGGRTKSLADAGLRSRDGYPYFSVECRHCANAPAFRGYGPGHGVGLCQAGAAALARDGMSWREILEHYYPSTTLIGG